MTPATLYKVILSAAAAGAGIAICLFGSWRFFDVPFNNDLWIRLYPASLMLMAAESMSIRGSVAIVAVSIVTHAALYFMAASALCRVVVVFRGRLRD